MKPIHTIALVLLLGCGDAPKAPPLYIFEVGTPEKKFWVEGDSLTTSFDHQHCYVHRRGSLVATFATCQYVVRTPLDIKQEIETRDLP